MKLVLDFIVLVEKMHITIILRTRVNIFCCGGHFLVGVDIKLFIETKIEINCISFLSFMQELFRNQYVEC